MVVNAYFFLEEQIYNRQHLTMDLVNISMKYIITYRHIVYKKTG